MLSNLIIALVAILCAWLILPRFKSVAAVTCMTAYRLLSASGLPVMGLRLAVVETDKFETEVLDGLKKMGSKQEELLKNHDSLQKETKQAIEDLTKVKNQLNSIAEFDKALAKVQLQLRRETRMAFNDPVRRIQNDDELRARFNGIIRLAAAKSDTKIREAGMNLLKGMKERSLYTGATPGSTFITDDLANEIYDVLSTYGVWNTFGVQRLGTTLTKFPVQTARPVAKFVRKLNNRKMVEDSTIAGDSVDCEVALGGVMLGVERELLEDAEFDVTSYVLDNFGEAMALLMDHVCLTADGTDDENDHEMEGIFESGTAANAAAGNTSVGTTDLDDWVNCLTTVAAGVLNRPARWWIHPYNIARACLVRDLNGRPIFQTAIEAPSHGSIGSILGYPVTPAHAAPSASQASAKIAAFGDPRAHVFGLRSDFGFDASDEFAFDAVKRMFRGLARFGAKTRAATGIAVLTLPGS